MAKKCVVLALVIVGLFAMVSAKDVADFTLKTVGGGTFKMSDYLGKKVVLLDFWATWCKPCCKFLKCVEEMKKQYPDVVFVAIAMDEASGQSSVEQYIKGKGYTFIVPLDPDSQVIKMYNPDGAIPFGMIVDKQGKIAFTHAGYTPGDEDQYKKKIEELSK